MSFDLICYVEQENTYHPVYKPAPGSIVTQAFIICKNCRKAIYHCMGPKINAVCLDCYAKKGFKE